MVRMRRILGDNGVTLDALGASSGTDHIEDYLGESCSGPGMSKARLISSMNPAKSRFRLATASRFPPI